MTNINDDQVAAMLAKMRDSQSLRKLANIYCIINTCSKAMRKYS